MIVGLLSGGLLAWAEIKHPGLGPWPGFLLETGGVFGTLIYAFRRERKRRWFWVSWSALLLAHTGVLGCVVSSVTVWRDMWYAELAVVEAIAMAISLELVRRRVGTFNPHESQTSPGLTGD